MPLSKQHGRTSKSHAFFKALRHRAMNPTPSSKPASEDQQQPDDPDDSDDSHTSTDNTLETNTTRNAIDTSNATSTTTSNATSTTTNTVNPVNPIHIINTAITASITTTTPRPKYNNHKTRLLDMDKLNIPARDRTWFKTVNISARAHLHQVGGTQPQAYEHTIGMINEAQRVWQHEKHRLWAQAIDPLVILTAALIHGIGGPHTHTLDPSTPAHPHRRHHHRETLRAFLARHQCPAAVAGPASHIASFIPYASATHDPRALGRACAKHPALSIVLDAERLHALGPMGATRALWVDARRAWGAVWLFQLVKTVDARCALYPDLMSTRAGAYMANARGVFMLKYRVALLEQASGEVGMAGGGASC